LFRASQGAAGLLPAAAAALACLTAGATPAAPLPAEAPATDSQIASVIPVPASVSLRAGSFALRDGARISVPQDPDAARIAAYFAQLLRASHGIALRVHAQRGARLAAAAIVFRLDAAAPQGEESYRLEVSRAGVLITARAPRGLFYGVVTLWQLCSARRLQDGVLALPALSISDAPRFRWRGLMLDSARHFQSPGFIMRYIDWMALHKLNVLGWHLTDDQGWRLEIRKYPRLTSVGAWRVPAGRAAQRDLDPATGQPRRYGGFYTQAQVRRIVAHAQARYVTLVPEIDLPAHATAALVAYPALAAQPGELPRAVPADWGIYPHLCNLDESTFQFIGNVFDEVLALFPGKYIHVGGDEVVTDQWRSSAQVQARMRALGIADVGAVQGYFERRLGAYLESHGRRLIGWDEILSAGLDPNDTVLSWRGVQGALSAAQAGHDAVLAPDPLMYLDHRQGTSPAEPPGRGAVLSSEDLYRFDPLPGALAGAQAHVLGVQANLWTEHVRTEERVAYMTWPRAAALAELAWSAPGRSDWTDFLMRLPAEFDRYRTLGIHYSEDVFAPARTLGPYERHMSQDLKTCTDKLVLNLEDDAPLRGPRAVFLIDIENPCWLLPATDLSAAAALTVAVGQVPFNFQIGKDREAIRLSPARTPAGELEVRVDGCEGAPVAALPLAPAVDNDAVTVLPSVPLPHLSGTHELCFRFAQQGLDPLWAIDWLQLSP
jgi:hexosaminidase